MSETQFVNTEEQNILIVRRDAVSQAREDVEKMIHTHDYLNQQLSDYVLELAEKYGINDGDSINPESGEITRNGLQPESVENTASDEVGGA
jgi:hypothetical protein